jgi:hypothetical protein
MPISFDCPECGNRLRVSDHLAGQSVKCPDCKLASIVPSLRSAPASPITARHPELRRRKRGGLRKPSKSGPSALLIVLSVVGGIALLSCLGVGGCVFLVGLGAKNAADNATASRKQDRQEAAAAKRAADAISIDQLLADYEANEVAADRKYKGKWLKVRGEVEQIASADLLSDITVTLRPKDGFGMVDCAFRDEFGNRAAKLRKGEAITVVGKCDGMNAGTDVTLRDCELVEGESGGREVAGPAQPRLEPEPPRPAPVDWARVGNEVLIESVFFELVWADHPEVAVNRDGEFKAYGGVLSLAFKVTNLSRDKVVRFVGWPRPLTVEDEFGNRYGRLDIRGPFAGLPGSEDDNRPFKGCDFSAITMGSDFPLHPKKPYATFLFFEKATAKSKEVRLIVHGESVGGSGQFPIRQKIKSPARDF